MRASPIGGLGGALALAALAGCETRPADPYNAPLRRIETDLERLYVQCVARDPLFMTDVCRQARLELRAGKDR